MNNRKWQWLFVVFGRWSDPAPRYRVLDLVAQAEASAWCRQWYRYPRPLISIKWMEIELPHSEVPRATNLFKAAQIPVEETDAGVRIWGWISGADRARVEQATEH